ncbi:hypothetical protein PENTCL1PPCAC_4004 [Pristionchus entomophagus]|uniref:Tr-type G domain-containing protein n=1 Tax=Pristionchus entomophagus TaxID=358040 RepID=A0AAV5SG36_9BILA|nr:hypothetical protein PENTCL1PPCAC_4004 [Pristionchus entomophagus]
MDFMVSNFCEEECGRVFNPSRQLSGRSSSALLARTRLVSELLDSDAENRLPPEMELGNIEYKAKLVSPSVSRLEHLITQMKWRLSEGMGEAIYELGVEDDGRMVGMCDEEYDESMRTLRTMADALSADIVECTEREVREASDDENGETERRRVAEVLIRRVPESQPFVESRLAVLGGADVGKSTLCGVLTHQTLDDGNGKTRMNQFRHPHEVLTGKTSSVCQDMIAFDNKGKILNYSATSVSEMVEQATKVVHLLDLAGDAKYLKTTIYGLSAYGPHAVCLIVSATIGPTAITREHLGLAVALSLPVFVVITKRDAVTKERLRSVMDAVTRLLGRAGLRGGVIKVKRKREAVRAASVLLSSGGAVPLLCVSSVTGEGMKALRCLLNALPPSTAMMGHRKEELMRLPLLFTVEETYQVPHVGEVACGVLAEGSLRMRDRVMVGPSKEGKWRLATVAGVRRAKDTVAGVRRVKVPVLSVEPGQAVSLSLLPADNVDEPLGLRRGMVLQCELAPHSACTRFVAQLMLLSHEGTTVSSGFEAIFFIGSVRQLARIEKVEGTTLRTGEWATVEMRFPYSCEFVRRGTPLIFRQGKTRGIGDVVEVIEE